MERRSNQSIHPRGNQSWIFIGRTDAEAETPILWPLDAKKRPWCWERWKAGGEVDARGWNGLMATWTRWTWVWASSGSWWWTGKPGVLWSKGSRRVGHDWATELNTLFLYKIHSFIHSLNIDQKSTMCVELSYLLGMENQWDVIASWGCSGPVGTDRQNSH